MVNRSPTTPTSGPAAPQATQRERDDDMTRHAPGPSQETGRWDTEAFVGNSPAMQNILHTIRLLQASPDTSVLITGETGTGKELVARAVHFGSARSSKPFVALNCAAIPTELATSMLFGHTKGSYTGATSDGKGCFEEADEGTVFLDEIGDMHAYVQAALLRVLEDGIVVPVGAMTGRKVNVRVVAATNSCVISKAMTGTFRPDLFYRLARFPFHIPPLRERPEDIPLLARHFARELSSQMGVPCPELSEGAMDALQKHRFPGNVRELKSVVERALLECDGKCIASDHLHFLDAAVNLDGHSAVGAAPDPFLNGLPLNLRAAERILAKRAVTKSRGNVSLAAKLMGISRARLYRLLATGCPASPRETG